MKKFLIINYKGDTITRKENKSLMQSCEAGKVIIIDLVTNHSISITSCASCKKFFYCNKEVNFSNC